MRPAERGRLLVGRGENESGFSLSGESDSTRVNNNGLQNVAIFTGIKKDSSKVLVEEMTTSHKVEKIGVAGKGKMAATFERKT